MILRDNVYGDMNEDAFRRDFTINALYYDPIIRTLVDYVGGLADLRMRRLKLIGDPNVRFREDPVRILRAIRFATKLGFDIEKTTDDAIPSAAYMISAVAPARLFDELCKLLLQGHATDAWELLQRYELADALFPDHNTSTRSLDLIRNAMEGTDQRVREDKPVTPGFLIAVLLWDSYRERLAQHSDAMPLVDARESASAEVLRDQNEIAAMPRRFAQFVREVWLLQPRLETPPGKGVDKLVAHPRFRAAYDFMLLRASVGEVEQELADWWTNYQTADDEQRNTMTSGITPAARQTSPSSPTPRRGLIGTLGFSIMALRSCPRALLSSLDGDADPQLSIPRRCRASSRWKARSASAKQRWRGGSAKRFDTLSCSNPPLRIHSSIASIEKAADTRCQRSCIFCCIACVNSRNSAKAVCFIRSSSPIF